MAASRLGGGVTRKGSAIWRFREASSFSLSRFVGAQRSVVIGFCGDNTC